MTTTTERRDPLEDVDRWANRLSVASLMLLALAVGLILGLLAGRADAGPADFPAEVSRLYPELADADQLDVLAYGFAVCAGYADGWTEPQIHGWLVGVPHEHLGSPGDPYVFAETFTDIATATFCP